MGALLLLILSLLVLVPDGLSAQPTKQAQQPTDAKELMGSKVPMGVERIHIDRCKPPTAAPGEIILLLGSGFGPRPESGLKLFYGLGPQRRGEIPYDPRLPWNAKSVQVRLPVAMAAGTYWLAFYDGDQEVSNRLGGLQVSPPAGKKSDLAKKMKQEAPPPPPGKQDELAEKMKQKAPPPPPGMKADVAEKMKLAPDLVPVLSRPMSATVQVRNLGRGPAAPSKLLLTCRHSSWPPQSASRYRDPAFPGEVVIAVPRLDPGEVFSHKLAFWRALRSDLRLESGDRVLFAAKADAGETVAERSEENNHVRSELKVP